MSFIPELLVDILGDFLKPFLGWLILWPLMMTISTPMIFILVPFEDGGFLENVAEKYQAVHDCWKRLIAYL